MSRLPATYNVETWLAFDKVLEGAACQQATNILSGPLRSAQFGGCRVAQQPANIKPWLCICHSLKGVTLPSNTQTWSLAWPSRPAKFGGCHIAQQSAPIEPQLCIPLGFQGCHAAQQPASVGLLLCTQPSLGGRRVAQQPQTLSLGFALVQTLQVPCHPETSQH